ncbi:MAG: hypothetical protein JWO12_3173 [Frankiales bacterium]|nr:hypothetical protein [Frankiales bacterium]
MNRYSPGKLGGLLAFAFVGLGLLFIGLGYNGAAGRIALVAQFPYLLSGGFVGLALVVFGTGLMINQSAREDRQRMEAVLLQILDAQSAAGGTTRAPADANGLFAAGTSSFHKPGCRLVDGREEVSYVTAAEAAERSLKACRVCQPTDSTNVTLA